MKLFKQITVICSTHQLNNPFEQVDNYALRTVMDNRGYSFKEAKGVWKNEEELSYVVTGFKNYEEALQFSSDVCKTFNQEGVLLQSKNGFCELVDAKGFSELLKGELKPITEQQAKTLDCYTKFNNQYWAVV